MDKILPTDFAGELVDAIGKHVPVPVDQTKRMEIEAAIEQAVVSAQAAQNQAQAETNKIEATSPRLWVSGWRPAIGWVCAVSLACYYVPRSIAATILWVVSVAKTGQLLPPPDIGIGEITGLVAALLGVAGLRTWEKKMGVQDKH